MIKIKRKTKRYLIISGMIAAVIILAVLIVHGVRSLVHRDADTSAGLEYIKQEEAGDVAEIEAKINTRSRSGGERQRGYAKCQRKVQRSRCGRRFHYTGLYGI